MLTKQDIETIRSYKNIHDLAKEQITKIILEDQAKTLKARTKRAYEYYKSIGVKIACNPDLEGE